MAAFDYKDPNCVEQINDFTGKNLKYIWDTISLPASAKICGEVISPGGRYGALLTNLEFPRSDVKVTYSLGYTAIGEPIEFRSSRTEAKPQDFEFMKKWVAEVEPLLQQGRIKVHPIQVDKGLENVLQGLDLMRHDKVSGRKLVYVL